MFLIIRHLRRNINKILNENMMEIDEKKFDDTMLSVMGKLDEIISCVRATSIFQTAKPTI